MSNCIRKKSSIDLSCFNGCENTGRKSNTTMKPLQGDSVNVNRCSCTSCDTRSESDCQTLKRLLLQGSKINKLLTGKYYVHLRESDLLDKLNKTRALYDALRRQLLSSNESSTADLKPRQSSREIRKAFVEGKKSSDIFALVDLVDKNAVLGLKKLSECCSCCTCSSKFRLHENFQKGRRNRLAYAGGNIVSVSKQETGEAKNIKSDPCTCACFKKRQIKKNRDLLEKVRPAKSMAKRGHISTPSNDLNLISMNNAKLRKSYHKLKRAKANPSPYMENIGEGGSKIVKKTKLVSNTIKTKGSIELLKTTKNVKYSFETDRKALQKKEPETRSTIKDTTGETLSRPYKIAIKLKDKVGGNNQVQSSKLKQRLTSRKINLPLEENAHIRDASSTSSTSIPKEISFIKGHDRKKCHLQMKQRNKKHTLAESNTIITGHPILNKESYSLKRSDAKKNTKILPYGFSPGKELINSNIATVSISSAKKRYPVSHKKSLSNSFNKINKPNMKTRSSIWFRKRLLLSAPVHFRPRPQIREEPHQLEEPVRHKIPLRSEELCPCDNCFIREALCSSEEPGRRKKTSKVKHKKNKSGSHGLKRCLCNIKFKINETKPKLSKNITNKNVVNDKQRSPSKSLPSSVKTFKKASNNDPDVSGLAVKCEGSDYVTQAQGIRKNKQATQNETNAHLEIKYNSADSNGSIEHSPALDIFNKTKLSIHALISDCVCKEVEQFMYKHYGKLNINVIEKSQKIQDEHAIIDSSNRIVSKCECFDENVVSDEIRKIKDRGKSNTALRINSTLKDASITTEKTWKLQNQAVQTVLNSTTYKTHKQKREKSLKHLEKKITYDSNPRFSIELMNKGYSNDDLIITDSKDNCVYKCAEGISQLPINQPQTSTTTTTKRDSSSIKNIPSILISQNNEMLTPILKRNKIKLPDMSTHRIRPHFSRTFYKNKRTSCLYCSVDKGYKIKQDSKILKNDTENVQKIMLLENTITEKEKTLLFDLTNKPCVCTSKLRKGKYYRKSSVVNADIKSNKIMPGLQIDAKISKGKNSNQLGKCKCNLDEYSEDNKSKKCFQIFTEKLKVTSDSSNKQLMSTSKLLYVKSDFQQQNSSIQKFKKMQINSESTHQPQYAKEIYLHNFMKQNVRMASNFSFNIEFYKSINSENNYYQNRTNDMKDCCLNNKQASNFLTKRYSSSHLIHLGNKNVSPINKCFCTLEISKMDEQRRNSQLPSLYRTKKQVYAMSTVTIAENKIKTPEILNVDHNFHCIDSYHSTSYSNNISSHIKHWQYFNKNPTCGFSISMIAFKAKNIQSYIRESRYKLLQIRSREQSLLDFNSNEAIRFESAFSCEVDYLKNICSKKEPIIRNAHSQNNVIAICQHNPLANQSQLTGVQPLLRRCYCTMNIQVAHQKKSRECDPHECERLIMKRLMKNVSKMSGTDSRSQNSAIETSSTELRSRKHQSGSGPRKHHTRGHYARPRGLKYQTLPRSTLAPAHRQAVKLGSTFSFDIEFSKGSAKSAPSTADVVKVPARHVSSRSSTTYRRRGMDRGTKHSSDRHHRETQSMMKQMRHRASNVTPMLKRCFCTLKLQKKGRQQKELELRTIHQGTSTPPKFEVESPVLRTSERGQNTKKRRKFQELLPYECEPGICIPGECDPYECLELIKRRNKHTKDFGTDSMVSSMSSSSMTSGQKRKMKRIQARNIRQKQVRSSYTSVRSKPSVMSIDTINRQIAKPSRQAVKISSNFSFNIEFYKDQTGGSKVSDRRPSEVYVHKAPKEVRRVPKKLNTQKRMREGSSQSGTSSRDDDSQIGIFQRGQSTMTSGFLKRCFCTAKLQGYNIDAGTAARRPPSKLKRCFCTLKLLSKRHRIKNGGVGHERATSVGMTQTRGRGPPYECVSDCPGATRTQTKEQFSGLLPYECEPGVCDPDNCDPYECIKLIRKRLAKEKMTGTEGPRTKSTSSYYSSSNPSRSRMTQYRSALPKTRMTQSRPARRRKRQDYDSSESVAQEKIVSSASPQRQAVRIGSNFSFNIEFYKDKGPNNPEVQMAAPVVEKYRRPLSVRNRGHGAYRRRKTRDKGFRGRRLPSLSRDTQMESIQSRDVGLGPILRRCFCTLKLQKKSKAKSKPVAKAGSKTENKAETSTETKADVKAINHKCLCDQNQTNTKNECTCTPPIKEVATLHNKSITTLNKPKENIMKTRKAYPYKLEPYECEPGVCVPGECDPYECLKLINKRLMHSSGTSTDRRGTRSSSNMAVCTNRDCAAQSYVKHKKKMKSRDTHTRRTKMPQPRKTRRRGRGRRRDYALSESVLQEKAMTPASPQRQAVRIGSNFSFNIEFYKDKGSNNLEEQVSAPVVKRYRRPVSVRDRGHGAHRRARTRDRGLRGRRFPPSLSRDSQMDSIQRRDIGLGPILKRCFCTLKLQQKSKAKGKTKAVTKVESKTGSKADNKVETSTETKGVQKKANHKCLCDETNKKNECTCTPPIKEVATLHDKSITTSKKPKENIMKHRKAYPYKLEPYECEPGVCVPGECDPYECLKLINKRLMHSSGTSTDQRETRSSSNMAGCTNRDCAAQSYVKHKKKMRSRDTHTRRMKMPQPRKTRRRGRGRRRDYALSESVLQKKIVTPASPQRQAVRIGSNFSFNIEFYKDKGPNKLEEQVSAPVVKRYRRPVSMRDRGHGAHRRARTRDRGLRGRRFPPSLSRDSQMDSIQSRDIGLGPILKRCFCTLKLQQKSKAKGKTKAVSKVESKTGSKTDNKAETSTETKAVQKKANHKCLCDQNQTNKKNECTCTPPIKEVATLHDKSITTLNKPKENIMKTRKAYPYKLEPYECEPGVCVPGECDPYECLKLINKRLMHSSGTSTDRRETRSTSNMAVCTNRDCEAQFIQRKKQMRTKNTHTRHRERRPHRDRRPHERKVPRPHRERRPESRSSELRSTDVENTTKQAVKIGSNFKFDIEFSKDKSNGGAAVINTKPIQQYGAYNKARRTSSRSTEGPSTNYRNQKAQHYKENHDIDSQASGPSMRSTVTGTVAPFLKRCFCTLQLNCRTENQGTPFECLVDITKAGKLKSQGKPEAIQFTVNRSGKNRHFRTQAQYHHRKPCPKLLPYECEPGVCVPGECDPYECLKRIKKRMKSKEVGTIYRSRSFSSSTGEGKKYRPRKIQTRSSIPRRRRIEKHYDKSQDSRSRTISSSSDERRKYKPRMKTRSYTPRQRKNKASRDDDQSQHDTSSYRQTKVVSDTKPPRQVVRIGSNFNFDIEFFKENSPQSPCKPQDNNITKNDGSGKRERVKRPNTRTISSDEKNRIRRRGAKRATITRAISTKSMSSYGKRYNPRDIQSQSEYKKMYSRGIGTPLLKRCFCTLKLEKKGRRREFNTRKIDSFKGISKKIEPSFKCVSKKLEPTTKSVSTHTKFKNKAIIEPVAREIGNKPKTCECDKGRKGHKCECKKGKKKNCKCYEKCECLEEPTKKSSIFTCKPTERKREEKEFPCKKGKECKCCKCNTYFMKTNKYRCKKGDICKCPICNTPALETNEFPCKKGKNCKCCKCNTDPVKNIQYRCKKGETCKCPICNTEALEQNENMNKNNMPMKQDQNFSPVNQDKCKCNKSKNKCKCNTQKRGQCLCEKFSQKIMPVKQNQNNIPTNQDNFPCKKGKECKCCPCNTNSTKINKYRCKKGEICKCPICNTPALEPNENKLPIKQDQNIKPVNQDTCRCIKSKNKCKCKQNKKNKNCKCFESCECAAEAPPAEAPPAKKPSTTFTCKTANKTTSTKRKYDPLKQGDLRDDCGVCESPYECLKRGIRRMYRPSGKRLKRRPRMSVSSIAATIVPGYTHKRTKYKGEPYSPDQIETVVEQPRYPFLHGKDARQGVKISSNFSFDIEFFKEMLPPVMDKVKEMDEDSQYKGKSKNRIKESYREGDTRGARYGAKNDYKYSDDSDFEPRRKSSPFEVLKKCFCTTRLQKSNYTQSVTVGRVQEIKPMSYFGPKEYLVQYQIQQPTRKYFKTNTLELKTIMSYEPSKYNKVYNNKRCYCHKCINRANPIIQRAQRIPKPSEVKESTFKKILNVCKNLFTKRSNKIDANKLEGWTVFKKEAIYQQPLIDILKASKSERHPKRVAPAEIKKTKSLKAAKESDVVYKKKYSRFQSGDHYKSQNTGIKLVKRNCKHCQNKLRPTIPVHDKVPFSKLRTAKALNSKLNDPMVIEQKKDPKYISFLFESPKFKNSENDQNPKVCSCCGGIKRAKNLLASHCLGIKNNILECSEDTTIIPKDLVGIIKTDKPERESTLSQEYKEKNNQGRCYICMSNSKQKAMQDKSDVLRVSGNVICKKEAVKCTKITNNIENKSENYICGTINRPAKSEVKVHALGSGYKPVQDQEKRNEEPTQQLHICEIPHKAESKDVIDKTMKEKYKLKNLVTSKTPEGTRFVTDSVSANQNKLSDIGASDLKSTYRKCQSYLRDHMQAWKKFQKVVFAGHGVETMRRLKLSCETRKYVKGGTGKLETHPITDVTKRFNNTDRKKGLHAKKPVWRRHSGSVFGWSPFMLSLRKRPWLSAYYKCAGFFPHCLTILKVWRQFMDIVLFMLAAAAVSPCLLGIELCKALKSCFLSKA